VILVKPSYRDTWEIPGGGLEHGEDPFQAAVEDGVWLVWRDRLTCRVDCSADSWTG
jgi:hypothetical protein